VMRRKYLALVVLIIAITATVIVTIALSRYISLALSPKIPPKVARLNITVVVLDPGDFAGRAVEKLSGRVDKVIVYSSFNPEILRHAGRSTMFVLSSEWLKENTDREEVREMIKQFIDRGSMVYINGTKAGAFLRMLYERWYEEGKRSGMSPEALQELRQRIESIPEDSQRGIGYIRVSEEHEVFVFGTLEDALKTLAEYRGVENR